MAEEMTNIEGYEPVESDMKVLIGLRKKSDGTKLAVTKEQYSDYDKRSWTVDGIILRNEDEEVDLMVALAESLLAFDSSAEVTEDIPETDKRRKPDQPSGVFTALDGEERTEWQMKWHDGMHDDGCAICEAIKYGWLPSCGEMGLLVQNREQVDELLELVGGTAISNALYWTSTQYQPDYMWFADMEHGIYNFWKAKTSELLVRPVKSASDYNEVAE